MVVHGFLQTHVFFETLYSVYVSLVNPFKCANPLIISITHKYLVPTNSLDIILGVQYLIRPAYTPIRTAERKVVQPFDERSEVGLVV